MTHPGQSVMGRPLEFWEDGRTGSRGYECASHEIHAAPGYEIVIHGWCDGKRQRIVIDDTEVDEFCRRLHQAKRYTREPRVPQ